MLTVKQGIFASLMHLVSSLSRRLIGLVSLIVLARILSPEDFGLVAIALIFLNFVTSITEIGGNAYVCSREKIDDQILYTNWTINLLIKLASALALAAFAPIISNYYDDNRLLPILLAFSLSIVFNALVSPGVLEKHKRQELGKLTAYNVVQRVITTGITVGIAIVFKTYWALVIGQLLNALFNTAISYYIAPKKPVISFKNAREQWEFSKWLLPQSFLNFFKTQIDAIFVSSSFAQAVMGGYNSMRYYAMIPSNMFVAPLTASALTQLSEIKNNKDYFIKKLQVINLLQFTLCVPLAFLMMTYASDIVLLILGKKWLEYAPLFAIFAATIFIVNWYNYLANILMLKDKTKALTVFGLASVLANVLMFSICSFSTIFELASYKVLLDLGLIAIFYVYTLFRLFGIKELMYISIVSGPSIIITLVIGYATYGVIEFGEPSKLTFIIEGIVFVTFYGLATTGICYAFRNKLYAYGYLFDLGSRFINKLVAAKQSREIKADE